ncbi:flagellar synthesis regulator FleN [Ralstonia sp. A12]|uniref:MinD/ParA family ATP-binding protein n=1 Tax=Ralstonia sp. A12 TaxID=1217052 RepID=UPI00057554B8|nr:flagellar synthesis regulator FleN [Ralstonia sp. A12]KHK54786.1 flagellar synthesis regulator FleN [Ralstonia sp. A12]
MTTPFAKDQAAGLRRMLGQVASRRVLVIGAEEQIDDFVDNLRIALSAMGRDAAVVSAQTMLAVAGMLEQHDDSADVTLVAAHFGSRALGTVAESCDDVLLVFSDGPEGIKSAYTLLKKTAGLQGGAGIRTVVCGAHSVDSAVRVFGNLANTVGQYLNTRIDFAGYLPEDRHVELALSLGKPVASAFPASPSAMAFRQLAEEMLSWASAEAQAADDAAMVSAQASTQTAVHESEQTTPIPTPRATARAAEMVY